MTLKNLSDLLLKILAEGASPDTPVYFDTDAARFYEHMVSIDSAYYEEEPEKHVSLHSKVERQY